MLTLHTAKTYFPEIQCILQVSETLTPRSLCKMPFPWSTSNSNNESNQTNIRSNSELNQPSSGNIMRYTCRICYGPLSHQTCPGPGAHLPGGSSNPHGLNCATAPIEFTSPDRIKHVGFWQYYVEGYKVWVPMPWPQCFHGNTFQPSEPPPYTTADGGEKHVEGAASGDKC